MDRIDELAIFVAIIDTGSLTRAARQLRRSPPAVTRALNALEARIGTRLVERSTRRLSATEAGRDLAEQARRLVADYVAATEGIAHAPMRGLLRVTAPVQFGRKHVAPVATGFLNAHPEMRIDLVLNDRNLDLYEEEIDVALRIGPMSESSLVVRHLGEVRRVIVAAPAYLERRGTPQHPRALAEHDVIYGAMRPGATEWQFESDGQRLNVRLAPRFLVNEVESQLVALRGGQGVAQLLSYQVEEDIAAGRLVRLLPAFEPAPLPVQLVTRSGARMLPKLRSFLDFAVDRMRQIPAIQPQFRLISRGF